MARNPDFGTVLGNALLPVASELLDMHDRNDGVGDHDAPCDVEAQEAQKALRLDHGQHRNPLELVSTLLTARVILLADYLRGIAAIAIHGSHRDRPVAFSPAALARATMEALAHIYWLAEPDVGHRERTRRVAVDTLHDLKTRARIVPATKTDDVEPTIDVDDVVGLCEIYGIAHEPGGVDQASGIAFPKLPGPGRPGAFSLMDQVMARAHLGSFGPVYYHLMTDIAHASTQGILARANMRSLQDQGLAIGVNRVDVLVQVAPILWALPNPIHRLTVFYGWDDERFSSLITEGAGRLTNAKELLDSS